MYPRMYPREYASGCLSPVVLAGMERVSARLG
jgi:hypothetical protein